ncbi:MAG: flagellar motor protein MotB [Elusimicrobia bacterium]|nr:flagellar motor protein MotB [Elusimicrobiota bacterium]
MRGSRDPTTLWMVPYADLMSIMTMLFLGLFGFAYIQRKAQYEMAIAKLEQQFTPKKEKSQLLQEAQVAERLEEELLSGATSMEITARRIRLSFASPILFDEGSADLRTEAAPILDKIASAVSQIPNPVWVEGHTDDRRVLGGRFKTNWELSAARAYSVVAYLIKKGTSPARLSILGYGPHRPIASNRTEDGRRKNRRIEISILRSRPEGGFAAGVSAENTGPKGAL